MNIICLVNNDDLCKKVDEVITSKFDIGIVTIHTAEDCMGIFEILDDVAAIIFDEFFAKDLVEIAKKNKLKIDFLYIGDDIISDHLLNLNCFRQRQTIN